MFRNRKTLPLALVFLLLAAGRLSFAQKLPAGPQVLTFFSDVDDTEQPYGLYLPKNFDAAKKYPLVIMLHGAGSNHRLALRRVFGKSNLAGENDVEATRYFPEWADVDYIVATPYARGTMGYQGIAEKDIYDVLADVKKRFPIDDDRVYLTGLSMGGGGVLWIGLSRPDIWAAIAPVCPAPPPGTTELAPNALNFPVHFFQGGADTTVNPAGTREWVKRLQDLGTQVEYTEYPGVRHNSWENAYQDEAIFKWFSQFRRNRYPDRMRFATSHYRYNSAYWVQVDELTPGTLASIDAKFTAPNRLEITTSALGAFTLRLAGHPKATVGRPLEVTIDGKALSAKAAESVSFSQKDGAWVAAKYEASANAKRPGAEGPVGEAVSSRHIYVYGTGGNPSREESQARRDLATRAADWARGRMGTLLIFPRVVADNAVRPSDLESSNLVLFGTKETNSLIAKFADRLPMQFSGAAEGYGLVYVFPNEGHYVVISSGLPWFTAVEAGRPPTPAARSAPTPPAPSAPTPAAPSAAAPAPSAAPRSPSALGARGFSFMGGPGGVLMGFEDYILFKGSPDRPENVVARGYFDANWRLPEADAEKMKATGAVTITAVQPSAR
jgi:poly(3-hydroxybutyrate) depolymerase